MNIKKLKSLIADLPDEMPVMKNGFDHSYADIYHGNIAKAIYNKDHMQFYEEDGLNISESEKYVNIFIIS